MAELNWIDTETLTMLQEVMEDEFPMVVDAFLQQATNDWPQAAVQLNEQDLPSLSRSAHSLKGSALSLGAQPLCETLEALEHAARAGSANESATHHADADARLQQTLTALRDWLADS